MNILILGLGYSAGFFARAALARGWEVTGTVRSAEKAAELSRAGIRTLVFGGFAVSSALAKAVAEADAVLVSVQPAEDGDPALGPLRDALIAAPNLRWIGYLSTIGVYGDQSGAWIDEATPPAPTNDRTRQRVDIEEAWLQLGRDSGKPVQIFRLSGIYGPGRNAITKLRAGTANRLIKPGQVFNRIHVDDIAGVLMASLVQPRQGAVYNVTDDEPGPPQDVITFAAGLTGLEPPPEIPFEQAKLSPMAASFYGESKRVSNALVKREFGYAFRYPTYREALRALAQAGE
ncbi:MULTISPECIES: SDR family oxidoreductase [Bosea]|uniref:SDR family oxidoreductase n=1 Tax=Bosea TaxID=85413 RepID=UPI00214FF948|nr:MULTISPECIES: SDR family oxidoreductase [Bosea]MCR4523292.1 SDR family oxidoreductase [Bosea sp. 47.2.35]MDR6831538.1 nucleoside-diphosphate-sugar epimerase [Bosea robiniae]MDR6898247.1 nucleoside-diphosphate-sugar epimerase [Bosea sp. BE109]MDR7141644.1 nucleoside-diphosphate-sugar epimerase [Bosea sp. BE168]MDR7178267.1 nucleoside-diphosphate-sugar epimerase [Bosea sp. BE271]